MTRSTRKKAPTKKQQNDSRYKDHHCRRMPQTRKNTIIKAHTPTSLTSRQKIVARNWRSLRRTSFNSTSALIVTLALMSWDCHAFWKSSKFMDCSFQLFRQLFADAVQFDAYIIF